MAYNEVFDLPYNIQNQNNQQQTLPFEEVLRRAMVAHTLKLRVCLPCSVAQINGNQSVNVQPLLNGRYKTTGVFTLPQIQNVPVCMPMGQNFSIKLPIDIGDTGFCVFSDRSLDAWLAGSGGVTDPQDSRQHDISDAIFIPGLVPTMNQTQDKTTDLVINNGKATAKIQRGGTFLFKNSSNELMQILDQTLQQLFTLSNTLSTDTVNTILGPQMLNAFSTYASIATQLNTLKGQLETLKGS